MSNIRSMDKKNLKNQYTDQKQTKEKSEDLSPLKVP